MSIRDGLALELKALQAEAQHAQAVLSSSSADEFSRRGAERRLRRAEVRAAEIISLQRRFTPSNADHAALHQ